LFHSVKGFRHAPSVKFLIDRWIYD
jgi:hypothetical protein